MQKFNPRPIHHSIACCLKASSAWVWCRTTHTKQMFYSRCSGIHWLLMKRDGSSPFLTPPSLPFFFLSSNFFFFFLSMLSCMWDLSSPTRDRTRPPLHWKCWVLTAGLTEKSPFLPFLWRTYLLQGTLFGARDSKTNKQCPLPCIDSWSTTEKWQGKR